MQDIEFAFVPPNIEFVTVCQVLELNLEESYHGFQCPCERLLLWSTPYCQANGAKMVVYDVRLIKSTHVPLRYGKLRPTVTHLSKPPVVMSPPHPPVGGLPESKLRRSPS